MKDKILEKIYELERAKNVKVLYACESGSRAWGFPSPDSDYDARFIYIKPKSAYLSIIESDGQIGYPVDEVLDISGWDLLKTLRLVFKSNATPFEWLQSPIIYREKPDFREAMWEACQEYFNPRALIHHYLGIAHGAISKTDGGRNLSVKKFFYIIRPVLAALWIERNKTIPPMNIAPLSELLTMDLKNTLDELILYKSTADEKKSYKIPGEFQVFINEQMIHLKLAARDMEDIRFKHSQLDDFFVKMIEKYDH